MAKKIKKGWIFDPKDPVFGRETKTRARKRKRKRSRIFSF